MTDKKTTMKKSDKSELSLEAQLANKKSDLLEAKKSHRAGDLVNPRVLGEYRKEIARIKTKLNAGKEAN